MKQNSGTIDAANSQLQSIGLEFLRFAGVVTAVAGVTALDYLVFKINSATAGFTFLVLILGLATWTSLRLSITASLISVAAYNLYFFPPIGTFTIADPQNWVALLTFLLTAVTASQLSSSARQRAEEARAREKELEAMYHFSRALMLGEEGLPLPQQVLKQVVQAFDVNDASFYDSTTARMSTIRGGGSIFDESTMTQVANTGDVWRAMAGKALVVPLKLGGVSVGSLGMAGEAIPSEVAVLAIAQLVTIAIERTRAQEASARVEAARENERFKSTLLDALAHEFKTPLTSVKAATTTLLSSPLNISDQRELVTIVDEEADRMTRLVNDSIELARIGSAPLTLKREACSAEDIVTSVVTTVHGLLDGRELKAEISPDLPLVMVDRRLSELALGQIVSNSLKYSPARSEVTIRARRKDAFVLISVFNFGSGIPKKDQERIFEKFYRAQDVRGRVPGTGLGLSITQEIIVSQGGTVLLESEPGQGVTFSVTLPIQNSSRSIGRIHTRS